MAIRPKMGLGDEALFKRVTGGIYKGVQRTRGMTFFTEFFAGLFYLFIGLGAFSIRALIRRKLGERSFGIFTIVFTFIWIRAFYAFDYVELKSCAEFFHVESCNSINTAMYYLYLPFSPIAGFFTPEFSLISFQEGFGNLFSPLNIQTEISYAGLFSLLFLLIAFVALGETIYRMFKKIRWHSYHRGKSSFFNWTVGKKIGRFVIKDVHVWMIFEPLLILMIGWIVSFGDIVLAKVLIAGAICLFLEEYSIYRQERNYILNMIDGEIEGDYLTELKEQYREDEEKYKEMGGEGASSEAEISI